MLTKTYQLGDDENVPMSDEEAAKTRGRAGFTCERGWENWYRLVGQPYYPQNWKMGRLSRTDK